MNFFKSHKVIILIIVWAFILRIGLILYNPPPLYGDELTLGYDVYSLLKTGHDQVGERLPITFSMGAGRPAGYIYLSIPFVAAFGLNEFSVRVLSALSGVGLVWIIYLLGSLLYSPKVGRIGALLASISIWDLTLSRGGFEAHLALFLASLGIYLFIKGSHNGVYYIFSAILFGLTINTYPTYKLSLALLLPILIFIYRDQLKKNIKYAVFFGVIISLFLGLSIQQLLFNNSEQRFSSINLFSRDDIREDVLTKVNQERNLVNLSFESLFHNKPLEYGSILLSSYLSNFSLSYLLVNGDSNPRHNPSEMGVIYYLELVTILIGLTLLFRNRSTGVLVLSWILIAAIPTSLLLENHSLRNSFMLPGLLVLSALGVNKLLESKGITLRILTLVLILGILYQFLFFLERTVYLSPTKHSLFWSEPAKLATNYINENTLNYDYLILSDRLDNIEYAYQVYTPVDPVKVIAQNKKREDLMGYQFKRFDNVYIGGIPAAQVGDLVSKLPGKVLFVGSIEDKVQIKDSYIEKGYLIYKK